MADETQQPDPLAVEMERFHGQIRLSIFNRMITIADGRFQATPLLLTAGTVGELIGLTSNGDARLTDDCLRELRAGVDRATALSAEEQQKRLVSLRDQLQMLIQQGRNDRRERKLIRHARQLPKGPAKR